MRRITKILCALSLAFSLHAPFVWAQAEVLPSADMVDTDTTNFDTNLSAADNTVQKALDTLDEAAGGSGDSVLVNGVAVANADLLDGTGINITLNAGPSPDEVTFAIDGSDDVTISGNWNASDGNIKLPNNTTCPATDCDAAGEAGRICIDTDATSGQQVYVCEGASGWVLQGDGGGAETNSLEATITGILDTEIFIGNGADSGTFKTVGGDATLANDGTLTIADNSVDGTDIAIGGDAQGEILYYDGTDYVNLSVGTDGQQLETNGASANPSWEWPSRIIKTRKNSVGTIEKGCPVYVTDYNVSGWFDVEVADADSATTMPAIGIAREDLTNAATGTVLISGQLLDLDTSSFSVGDELYADFDGVATFPECVLTAGPATEARSIQKMAEVVRSNVSNGSIIIYGAGRANAVSNLDDAAIFVGNASNQAAAVAMSGDVTIDNTGVTTIGADKVALTTNTTGNYAAGDAEAGNALTGDTATAFFSSGTIEHERGGLEADVSGYGNGLFGTNGTATIDVDTEAELETALGSINVIVATEIDSFSELDTLVSDKALVNKADGAVWLGAHDFGGATTEIDNGTVASLPAAGTAGRIAVVTDGNSDTDCTVGGGSTYNLCIDNGAAWTIAGDGGAGSVAFSAITGATNTSAAMVVGTGASLAASGSGTITATAVANDGVTEAALKAVDAAVDEECLTYESTTGDFEWQTCGGGGGGRTSYSIPVYSARITGSYVTHTPSGCSTTASTQGAQISAGDGAWKLLYDAATDEAAMWQFVMPDNYSSAPILDVHFSMASAEVNEVEWEAAIMCVTPTTDNTDIDTESFADCAVGTATTVDATAGRPYEQSITLTDDSCAAGDDVWIWLSTDADDPTNDDAAGDREVIGLDLRYTSS